MKKALVLSLAAVLCLGFASFAQSLFGTWDTLVCFDNTTCCPTLETTLEVNYEICGWTFTSTTAFNLVDGWTDQSFGVTGALGAFTIGSDLVFNPDTVAFESWAVTTGINLAGVNFDGTFTLVPGDVTLDLVVTGEVAGCLDVEVDLGFGEPDNDACDFNWAGVEIGLGFEFCCADIEATIIFDCDGFVSAEFCAVGITFPTIDWVALDVCFTFTPEAKTYDITTTYDFGIEGCFDLYVSDPAAIFGDVSIDGIGLTCTIGGVEFTGISYWGHLLEDGTVDLSGKPAILGDYWEMYQIATTDDGCCGTFEFSLAIFFLEGGSQLFDVSAINTSFDIGISEQFTLGMTLDVDLEPTPIAFTWCLHFLVEW